LSPESWILGQGEERVVVGAATGAGGIAYARADEALREDAMKCPRHVLILLVLSLVVSACVAGPNPARNTLREDGSVAGFWKGLWHGVISPVTFIISLFSESVHFYEVHNNGGWYDFGFVLGAGILAGGGSAARKRR
jgi:hypothetical protein